MWKRKKKIDDRAALSAALAWSEFGSVVISRIALKNIPKIGVEAFAVFCVVRAHHEAGQVGVSWKTLQEETGLSEEEVRRAWLKLREFGLILENDITGGGKA